MSASGKTLCSAFFRSRNLARAREVVMISRFQLPASLPLVAGSICIAVASMNPAAASCMAARPLATGFNDDYAAPLGRVHLEGWGVPSPYHGYPYSSGSPPVSPDLQGVFWAIGAGDPALGAGVDNGSHGVSDWVDTTSARTVRECRVRTTRPARRSGGAARISCPSSGRSPRDPPAPGSPWPGPPLPGYRGRRGGTCPT